ncbi:MAG: acetolactate synthase large subunit [bacterium]|nr:acetolactate synthase large subunit [bacterium]
MKVSDLFVKALEKEGVKYVFGVPGEENQDLLFSMAESSVTFVPCRHENGAAFIADAWGRLTGQAGVCLATLGPGATNLITGVANANFDKSPLVAITGQGGITRKHHESHQYIDVVSMYKPVTKWNTSITMPEITAESIRKAFKLATLEKPGATHIELPEDVASKPVADDIQPIKPQRVRRAAADYKAIRQTVELLETAKRPLIIAGNGAVRKLASRHLTDFATEFDIPVATTFMGKGAISDKLPQSLGTIGTGFKDYILQAVEQADLILAVGYDMGEYAPEKWNPRGDKKIVHIDFVPADVYNSYQPEVEVVCDVSDAFWQIQQKLERNNISFDSGWYSDVRQQIIDDIKSYDISGDDSLTVPGTLNVLRQVMNDDGLLFSDIGSHKIWIARNFPTYVPNGTIVGNGFCSMGASLPAGIAAKLIDPNRQVVTAMGDGGFMMNSQEIETAQRLGLGYTILVFNDNDYGLISWKQRMNTDGKEVSTRLTNPDFKAYAESFGIAGYSPSTADELRDTLQHTLATGELALVEVKIDPAVNQELYEKLKTYYNSK